MSPSMHVTTFGMISDKRAMKVPCFSQVHPASSKLWRDGFERGTPLGQRQAECTAVRKLLHRERCVGHAATHGRHPPLLTAVIRSP